MLGGATSFPGAGPHPCLLPGPPAPQVPTLTQRDQPAPRRNRAAPPPHPQPGEMGLGLTNEGQAGAVPESGGWVLLETVRGKGVHHRYQLPRRHYVPGDSESTDSAEATVQRLRRAGQRRAVAPPCLRLVHTAPAMPAWGSGSRGRGERLLDALKVVDIFQLIPSTSEF